jgi:hypothetical protein
VCERHFENSCFDRVFPRKILKKDAVPTVFTIDECAVVTPPPPPTVTPQSHWLEQQHEDPSAIPGSSHSQPENISKDAVPTVFTTDECAVVTPPPPATVTPQGQWLEQHEDSAATPGSSHSQPDHSRTTYLFNNG